MSKMIITKATMATMFIVPSLSPCSPGEIRNKKVEIENKMSGKELYFTLKKHESRNRKQDVWKRAIFHSKETRKQKFKTGCLEKSYISL